jgi:hypothetical protein
LDDGGYGITTGNSGNVYITGCFRNTVDFNPTSGDLHTPSGQNDVFLSKFDSLGNFEWTHTWGGSDIDEGCGVSTDNSGNIYVTGEFQDTVDFDPAGGDPHTSEGARDVFLSKFNSSGNFEWVRTWGGLEWDCGTGVTTDSSGNVYVIGYFEDTVDFNPAGGDRDTSNGYRDVFLSKFDSSGNFKWARTWGGVYRDSGSEVTCDNLGNVYVTGYFKGTVDLNPTGGDQHTSDKYGDAFLTKFDSSGNFDWARTWGWSKTDKGVGVITDNLGSVYVTGCFETGLLEGAVDFNPDGGAPYKSNGLTDVFLSKFDSSGTFDWARVWGGSSHDCGTGVAADSSGNVYVTGYFHGTVDFNPAGGECHASKGPRDAFISRFNSSGNFDWVCTWGGASYDSGYGVTTDALGNIYVTGVFKGTVDFNPYGGEQHTSNGGMDIFLSKFHPEGN